jgi:hypothetical protein
VLVVVAIFTRSTSEEIQKEFKSLQDVAPRPIHFAHIQEKLRTVTDAEFSGFGDFLHSLDPRRYL